MPNPTTRWDRVPVFGVWLKVDDTPSPGKVAFGVGQRVTRVDGREIYPEGAQLEVTIGKQDEQDATVRSTVRAAWRAADAAAAGGSFDAVAWDTRWDTVIVPAAIFARFPAADDPDIVQSGYSVTVSERLASGKGKSYSIQPLLSQLDLPVPGINLGLVEVPPDATSTPAPVYAKGVPGGVAALDADGNVVNAHGVVVLPAGEPAAGSVTNATIAAGAGIELTKTVDAGDRFAMTSAERAKIADAALANQVVPVGRTVTAGEGLQGGGDLGADRTLSVRFGTAHNTAVRGNDSRLSDARPPIAHDASLITSGLVAPERLGTGTASSETVLYGDGVFRPPSGGSGGSAADVATVAFSASQPIVGGVIVAATPTGPMTWSDGPADVWLGRVRSALIDQTLTLGVRVWGSAVAFQLYTRSTYATAQVRVNGRLITPRAGTEIPNSSVDGNVWVHVTFAGVGPHDVQVTGQTVYHMAVAHEADGSIAPATLPTSTARVIVLGDSWIGGALDVPAHATIPSALGDALGLDVWGAGQGGTGYVATGPGADDWTQDFGDSRRLAPIIAAKPTDVVVLGSVNDNSAAFSAIRDAAEATFAALVAALPTVRLHVVLPQPTTVAAESDAAKLANRAAVRAAAEASPRMFTIVDGGAAGWITAGNQARFIGVDNVHPTQEGHDYVAALIAEKIRPALMPGAAPLPVVYASDSFTRADGAVGSTEGGSLTWTALVDNAWSILSGQLKPPAVIGDTGRGAKLVVDVGQTDFAAQVYCTGGNWGIGLLFRANADGSGYVLIHNSNTVELRNLGASGAGTLIQNWYPGPATSYTLGVRCSGTTITCLRDGVPLGTVTDATHTGTRVGVRAQSSERAADNFRVAALS